MSVIAKLIVSSVSEFGTGRLVQMHCMAENDLMAGYAADEQDKLFTKYSPSGDLRLNQPAGYAMGAAATYDHVAEKSTPASAYYVMLIAEDEATNTDFKDASACGMVVCYERSEFATDTVQVEFRDITPPERTDGYGNFGRTGPRGIHRLSWRMSIDNPPASDQIKAGRKFWVAFYPADTFDRNAAIAAAHGRG